MKISQVNNNKRQNFSGIKEKAVESMVKAQDKILNAGLAATFVAQDVVGAIAPRVLTGLTRNSDKTGQLNYQFAAMEACREFLSGPPLFMLPFAAFALVQKPLGFAIKAPVSTIEAFSDKLSDVCKTGVDTPAQMKKTFYAKMWDDALKTSCGKDYTPKKEMIDKLTDLMGELETSRNYTLKDKFKKTPKFRTSKDITADITKIVTEELRSNADVTHSFTSVAYKDGLGKQSRAAISTFADNMCRFAKDSANTIGKSIKKLSPDKVLDEIKNLKNKKVGSRVITNIAITAAAILYATQLPKLYKSLNKSNPGLIGLTDEAHKNNAKAEKIPVNYEAFDKLKKSDNKPAFKGLRNVVSKAVRKDGFWRKLSNKFEYAGADMSFSTLVSVLSLGILAPRVVNSYDKHDRREILTRDIFTLSAMVVGAKALLKNISRNFEKKTGIVLTEKGEKFFEQSKGKQLLDHMNPAGGVQVFSNGDIALKYSNVDKFKGGFAGFCEYISKQGGNLVKFFENDKTTKENMEKMLGKKLSKSTDKEIMSAINNKENATYLNNIINVFKNPNNTFIKKAKSVTGVFGFVSTLIAVPAFMIFLQKLNEHITKGAIAKEKAEKKQIEEKFDAIKLTSDMIKPDASTLNMK